MPELKVDKTKKYNKMKKNPKWYNVLSKIQF
jgi:hypothetical protein